MQASLRALVATVVVGTGCTLLVVPAHAAASRPAGAATTNLVADPSFETPAVSKGQLDRFSTGDSFGSWTVVGASGTVDLYGKSFSYQGDTFPAKTGKQSLDLTGNTETATGVAQSVPTTPGVRYTLTFYVGNVDGGSDLGTTSTVLVSLNGKQVDSATNSQGAGKTKVTWEKFTVPFTASKAHTTVQFINGDPSGDTTNLIDAISIA